MIMARGLTVSKIDRGQTSECQITMVYIIIRYNPI